MTSIPPVSVPASGVSARPLSGIGDSGAAGQSRARAVRPVDAPVERRPEGEPRQEREAAHAGAALTAGLPPLDAAAEEEPATARSPLERASDAYRRAGAEPPRYSSEPRVFSVTV